MKVFLILLLSGFALGIVFRKQSLQYNAAAVMAITIGLTIAYYFFNQI